MLYAKPNALTMGIEDEPHGCFLISVCYVLEIEVLYAKPSSTSKGVEEERHGCFIIFVCYMFGT